MIVTPPSASPEPKSTPAAVVGPSVKEKEKIMLDYVRNLRTQQQPGMV